MEDNPNSWSFDPEDEWGNPLEKDGKAKEVVEDEFDPQYQGFGNERFLVMGSNFVCDPEIEFILDREIGMRDKSLSAYTGGEENIGDIVVSRGLWNSIEPNVRKILDSNPVRKDHYPINFREKGANGNRYAGFLRVEDNTGYDVILETESGNQSEGPLQGYPMV